MSVDHVVILSLIVVVVEFTSSNRDADLRFEDTEEEVVVVVDVVVVGTKSE